MIHREGILHIPLSQYAYAPAEDTLTIRLRAAKDNLERCLLYYADRAWPAPDPIPFTGPVEMAVTASDDLFEYYEITLKPGLSRVCYYFELTAEGETAIYCADLFMREKPGARSEFYQYPFIRREELSKVPEWFQNAVVYNIFPDSFASGKGFLSGKGCEIKLPNGLRLRTKLGGTLNGITENLGYIHSMGFNTLYLNPIFTAVDYHKYDLTDYYHIDPCFGTDNDFARLVDTAHAKQMRVIVDGVFNHCGKHFFAFEDVVKNGEASEYAGWFYDLEYPVKVPGREGEKPAYSCFAYEPKMPKLNTSNPAVRDYFMEVCRHWTRNYRIDGWRLDVANEVDREFWRAFRRTALAENPECVLIAEIWESAESWLQGDMFHSTMNYDFRKHCRDFFALGHIDAAGFNARCTQMRMRYPEGILHGQLNLLNSHDVSRFLTLCGGDIRRLKLAVLFLAVFPGVPSVFYGDELGIQGTEEPQYRQAMPWGGGADMVDFFAKAMALRGHPAVTGGGYETITAKTGEPVYVFRRVHDAGCVTIALNASQNRHVAEGLPHTAPQLAGGLEKGCLDGLGYAVWVE